MTTIPFTHLNQSYEIRCVFDGHTYHVRAFKDGKPANGFTYTVSFDVAFAMKTAQDQNIVDIFVEDAKRDITEDRWAKLLLAIKESESEK